MNRLIVALLLGTTITVSEPLTLTVTLTGLKTDRGAVEVALFDQPAAFPTKPERAVATQRASVAGGEARVEFRNLVPGTYAVSAYHDVNGNGKMDTNFIGIPKEPTGASNDAKGRMGPPWFKDAQVTLSGDLAISVSMR